MERKTTEKNNEDLEKIRKIINELIETFGGSNSDFDKQLVSQMIESSLKLLKEKHDTGQLKLMNRSLKEMRYAYKLFNQFKGDPFISIFGSSRTPPDHPDYKAAMEFGKIMGKDGWKVITGAAHGIMKAGLEGVEKTSSFGLSIKLPLELTTNDILENDPKLVTFRYFFTRKLIFVSQAKAFAAFPGGYGTLDELFEVLTLMQTGKTNIAPIVLVEGEGESYWKEWQKYIDAFLLEKGWISPEDKSLYYLAKDPEDAKNHVEQFYKNYHSSRYFKDYLVIRIKRIIPDEIVQEINKRFKTLLTSGVIEQKSITTSEEDQEFPQYPRIVFQHNRKYFGLLRQLIDLLNNY